MTIRIVEEPEVVLTRDEYDRLMHEYQVAHSFYYGPVPSFEDWVRRRQQREAMLRSTGEQK